MRQGWTFIVAVWLLANSSLLAQSPPSVPPTDSSTLPETAKSGNPALAPALMDNACCQAQNCDTYRFWARSEYLLWWVKNAPIPVPLVTTGDPNIGFAAGVNTAGAIGQPGTQVLFGNNNVNYNAFSGMRMVLGGWLDTERRIGIEGSGFFLEHRANQFAAGSDPAGNPPLYFPAFNVRAGAERGNPIADPLRGFNGDVFITSALQLWGAEVNGCFNLWRRPGLEVSLLAGLRYMDLTENLHLHSTTVDLILGNTQVVNDTFDTRNQFYGGQLGTRISMERDRFSLDLTGKVALGNTHQVVNIQGDSAQTALPGGFAPTPGSFPGGVYAQPSNIGRRTSNEFSVIPAVEMKLGYQLTARLKAYAGYDFLYWNQVVRPGNQIDRNINPSQSTLFGNGALIGPASPAPLFQRTDFWAHGVNFGVEMRF